MGPFFISQMSWNNCCQRQPQMLHSLFWGDVTMAGDAVREATFVDVRVGNLMKSSFRCFHQKAEFFSRYQPIMIRYVPTKKADVFMKWLSPLIETMVSTLGNWHMGVSKRCKNIWKRRFWTPKGVLTPMLMNWSKEIKLLEFHGWNHFRDGRNSDSTGGLQRSLFFTSSGLVARHVLLLVGGLKLVFFDHLTPWKIIKFDKHISQMGWNHQVDWIVWVFLSKARGGPFDAFAQRRASTTSINACKDNYKILDTIRYKYR